MVEASLIADTSKTHQQHLMHSSARQVPTVLHATPLGNALRHTVSTWETARRPDERVRQQPFVRRLRSIDSRI
eukprot:4067133-Pleurochrysis_carterae.AAC.2